MIYDSLLIANRGEIACRIIQTAQEMGIRCIAVYVDADKNEPFVHMSDQSIRLTNEGYLDSKEIIKAAKESGAQAIHPGYGFLSENASFARKVIKEGLIWVGPSPHVISVMGDKLKAKELAEKAGVPTLPMTSNINNAKNIGFPLLIKAAAGGGGKGMRIVSKEKDLKESIKSAQREAQSGFGDDRVFIERYVQKSRHIEIQILGDAHGNVVHLGERECSIQRRHQKIIEESPSPRVSENVRTAMGNAAIKLAKKIKYKSAGTVEFLFDDKTEEFWFLEVNTRLQVEHPITEEVTGIDLVSEQLRIAREEELGYAQDDITFMGHSIEARLYAENPDNEFLPETGEIIAFERGPENDARWDSGINIGSKIGTNFDPMLAKIISFADTRNDAILKLIRTLESAHIGGVITNREFLIECLKAREFFDGNTTTDFINQVQPNRKHKLTPTEIEHAASIAALWIQRKNRIKTGIAGFMPPGWTNGRLPKQKIDFVINDNEHSVSYRYEKNKGFVFDWGKIGIIHSEDDFGLDIEFNGKRHYSRITLKNDNILVHMPFGDVMLKIKPRFVLPGIEIQAGSLTAPMPGKVIALNVKKGSKVKTGDVLVILEAMKMEHSIKASHNGVVSKVLITKDDQVENGAPLMIVDSKIMQYSHSIHSSRLEPPKPLTKKHKEIISTLEKMLEKGIPELTMSELAAKLKISLRTLYEIAPSKDQLITMTVDNILKELGKSALERVSKIESPIDKLDTYLGIVNQAVGPKFDAYIKGLGKINGSSEMIDYHEDFITKYTEKLLVEAMSAKEIQRIDPKAFAILLGGIGREFAKSKNRSSIDESPEMSANSVTKVILKGIRLEN